MPVTVSASQVVRWCANDVAALEVAFAPLMRDLSLPPAAFVLVPGIARFLEVVAAHRIMAQERSFKRSDREALRTAARRLGLTPKALAKRIERLARAATKMSPASD